MQATRIRLRGAYAIAAAAVMLLAVPIFEALALAPSGYGTAAATIGSRSDFTPPVLWIARNGSTDRALRLIELLPYLLILPLPWALAWAFWDERTRMRLAVVWTGRIGGLCVLVAGVAGIFTSTATAGAAAGATTAAQRLAAVASFVQSYVLETLLAQVCGGVLLGAFVLLVSIRIIRTHALLPALGYGGLLVAALLAATAFFYALSPAQAQVPSSGVAYVAFALWLVALGVPLVRVVILPADEPVAAPEPQGEPRG